MVRPDRPRPSLHSGYGSGGFRLRPISSGWNDEKPPVPPKNIRPVELRIAAAKLNSMVQSSAGGPLRRAAIDRAIDNGLLELGDGRIRFTDRGLLFADSVVAEVL